MAAFSGEGVQSGKVPGWRREKGTFAVLADERRADEGGGIIDCIRGSQGVLFS